MRGSSSGERAPGERRWQVRTYVLHRRDYNEMRLRLPRAVRRGVEAAPEGHVGLVAQAIVGADGETPLAALYDNAPAVLAQQRLCELTGRLGEMLDG